MVAILDTWNNPFYVRALEENRQGRPFGTRKAPPPQGTTSARHHLRKAPQRGLAEKPVVLTVACATGVLAAAVSTALEQLPTVWQQCCPGFVCM